MISKSVNDRFSFNFKLPILKTAGDSSLFQKFIFEIVFRNFFFKQLPFSSGRSKVIETELLQINHFPYFNQNLKICYKIKQLQISSTQQSGKNDVIRMLVRMLLEFDTSLLQL
ncbi:Hypothetical_protein [Hexamita inflata]|uniref:Hypothetical_protein n=1 Tax=Hexamita inflata TaxID=28002 RepID=A0ABP1HG53_9EUKA